MKSVLPRPVNGSVDGGTDAHALVPVVSSPKSHFCMHWLVFTCCLFDVFRRIFVFFFSSFLPRKVYDPKTLRFDQPYATGNCAGEGTCGTCFVEVRVEAGDAAHHCCRVLDACATFFFFRY